MDSKFETEGVDPGGEGREGVRISSGRKAVGCGEVASVGGEREAGTGGTVGMSQVPAFVDDDVLPVVALEMLMKPVDVGLELRLGDSEAIGVPAVPAQRRRRSDGCGGPAAHLGDRGGGEGYC